jgi:hypothetical protein
MTTRSDTVRPTLAAFVRHAQLFGPECVVETASGYLSEVEMSTLVLELALLASANGGVRARRRRTTDTLRAQVVALRERGLVPAAIADVLAVSDRRVASILARSTPSENGARKRLNQAELFAL